MNRKKLIILLIVVVLLAVGGYFGYQAYTSAQSAAASNYQTARVEIGDLTAIVGATGTVRSNQSTTITWQTSGRISEIKVAVGDEVKANQALATLNPNTLPQNIILAQADLVTAQRNLENLMNSDVAKRQAQLNVAQAVKKLDDVTKKQNGLEYKRGSQDQIDTARANYILANNEMNRIEDLYKVYAAAGEGNPNYAAALSAMAAARTTRDRALANLNYLMGKPEDKDINDINAQVDLAKAQLADANREWERVKNGPDPSDIAAAKARITAIESTLKMDHLEAPFAGTISEVRSKVGDQISAGTVTFRLDDLTRLLVDVQVTEVDINRIQVGAPATMTFDAIQGKEYQGKVVEVARVGTVVSGVVNFVVTIEISNPDQVVRSGMTSAVNIVVSQVKGATVVPNRAVRLRDGKRVVYALRGGVPTPVEISIGASSDQFSEVTSGDLSVGETIILNPPSDLMAGGRSPFMR